MVNRQQPRSELPYHLIVPSLVGYAFSSKPPLNKNFRIEDGARILDRFMDNLGFGSGYVVHGGDLGSDTARVMGAKHASCKGESRMVRVENYQCSLIDISLAVHSMLRIYDDSRAIN